MLSCWCECGRIARRECWLELLFIIEWWEGLGRRECPLGLSGSWLPGLENLFAGQPYLDLLRWRSISQRREKALNKNNFNEKKNSRIMVTTDKRDFKWPSKQRWHCSIHNGILKSFVWSNLIILKYIIW